MAINLTEEAKPPRIEMLPFNSTVPSEFRNTTIPGRSNIFSSNSCNGNVVDIVSSLYRDLTQL